MKKGLTNKGKRTEAYVPAEKLSVRIDPNLFGVRTSAELEPLDQYFAQDRATGAMRFGASIDQPGFNLFVMGRRGSGRRATLLEMLNTSGGNATAPDDWVYVSNFKDERRPKALRLPSGIAKSFAEGMQELVDDLAVAIPAMFESEDYKSRRRAVDEQHSDEKEALFDEFGERVRAQDVTLLQTPLGFALAPTHGGEVVKPDVFRTWAEADRKSAESKIADFQGELSELLQRRFPQIDKAHRTAVRQLEREAAGSAIEQSISEIRARFVGVEPIIEHLAEVESDLLKNFWIILSLSAALDQGGILEQMRAHPALKRYQVNTIASASPDDLADGRAPVVELEDPSFGGLVGRIEHRTADGALVTDFTLIRPGALHRANGGFLVLDARELLSVPLAWPALKRALKTGRIHVSSVAEQMGLVSTISLEPEDIPLSVKVAMIGDRRLYYMLSALDPDFNDLFKVVADFDDDIDRTDETTTRVARRLASMIKEAGLRPASAEALARVLKHASRLADDSAKITLVLDQVVDVVREADQIAKEANQSVVAAEHVEAAIRQRSRRAERIRVRGIEAMTRGIVNIATDGEAVGQVNGLSVVSLGTDRFGRPSRITARTRMGSGKVIDIEREVELGGPLHSKGVLILQSFLATRFGGTEPMSLGASIVFEQSYGGVDGDSASSAELYALLSSLADAPVRQSLAVTGSVDQFGSVQAIGGVNEKIEGFFDLCNARGLTGQQGVLIPRTNVQHLNLRADVAEAVEEGKFSVVAVQTIDQGIELLTGIEAGAEDDIGDFPKESINFRVANKLAGYAEARRRFGANSANLASGPDR